MPSKYELCPQCGAIQKNPVCMKCGYDASAIAESSDPDVVLELNESQDVKPIPEKIEAHEQVRSIFTDIAVASGVADVSTTITVVRKRFITPVVLSVVFLMFAGLSYWRFIYFTPEFVSPLVLSAADIKAIDGAVESTESMALVSENEKTVELDTQLEEGNFASRNFAQFGATSTKVLVQAFNIKTVFERFGKEAILQEIQEEYDISDDDLGVYFSKGFAYYVPGENLDTWGFAIGVNDEEYVTKRLDQFRKNKENLRYKYFGYFADLVEVEIEPEDGEEAEEETPTADDEKSIEEADATEEERVEQGNPNIQYYLLISNSNEYRDQMKEASEGNLTNLANEATYARSNVDLPQLGEVLVYKEKGTPVWATLVDIAASRYDYVGLDKILSSVQSVGSVFYSVDSKLRISMSED